MHSIDKKRLPINPYKVYGSDAPAKSGAGIGLPELIKAIHDAPSVFFCVVNSVHPFFSVTGIIRVACKIMVGCVGASPEAPGSLITGKTNSAQSTTSKIGLFCGGSFPLIKEAAAMLATAPTQNPQFIWLFLAISRANPQDKPHREEVIATSELAARKCLSDRYVLSFAGRLPVHKGAGV